MVTYAVAICAGVLGVVSFVVAVSATHVDAVAVVSVGTSVTPFATTLTAVHGAISSIPFVTSPCWLVLRHVTGFFVVTRTTECISNSIFCYSLLA